MNAATVIHGAKAGPIVAPIVTRDHQVATPAGPLFARTWASPAQDIRQALVLLHDSLGSVALWRDFPEALCRLTGWPVIAYDRLGFGRSAPHPGRLPLDFIAAEASAGFAAIQQHFGLHRFALFGHSVGGGMAVHCAARHSSACLALITVSAQAFVEDKTLQGIEAARQAFVDPQQIDRLTRYHGDKTRWVLDAWIKSWQHPDFAAWSLQEVLPRVTCPLLVIHGSADEYGSLRHPEMICAGAGGPTRLEVMHGTHHVPHRENPATVLALVADFLGSASSSQS